ncbi:MAG: hypothetical protein ABI867_15310, partial [Kofleriaceae bacterium]
GASAEDIAFSNEVIAQIRALASNDWPVHRILDAIALGACECSEIRHLAKMSPGTYHKARIRLGRVVARVSNSIVTSLRNSA